MTISQLKKQFISELNSIYELDEATAIFYLALHGIEAKTKTDELLGKLINDKDQFFDVLRELKTGKPVQYILGFSHFAGLKLKVNENVLIPRPETEELVAWIVEENPLFKGTLLDIGTGSGCIALGLKSRLTNAQVSALDVSKKAIEVAQENALTLALNIEFLHSNILEETPINRADILVSNPPYIGTSEKVAMHINVLEFEPHLALFVEEDVLIFYKRLALLSEKWNSIVYAETSEFYCDSLANWLTEKNFIFEFRKDLQGKSRFVKIRPNTRD